ncbi:MAG TPA: chemotaxis protein CheB, partial [Terracidiphilus sp.]|nr:chemotaxis protein CheB [Terracidiphilus sp.]
GRFGRWPRRLCPVTPAFAGRYGVAIVIVNHLRTVATLLHEILPRYTEMPVELITERLLIQPNRVFIIPEQRDLHVLDGEFRLKPISKPSRLRKIG